MKPVTSKAEVEYAALNDGSQPTPSPPAHAAQLNALIKTLASAEEAVSESLRTRRALIEGLEKLLDSNRRELAVEEKHHGDLMARKEVMATRRHEVEDQIMRALPNVNGSSLTAPNGNHELPEPTHSLNHTDDDVVRPEMERFTPPIESTTPPGMPPEAGHVDGADDYERPEYEELTPPRVATPPTPPPAQTSFMPPVVSSSMFNDPRRRPGTIAKSAIVDAHPRPGSSSPANSMNSAKRRKASGQEGEYPGFGESTDAMDGLDAEVVGMLG